MASQPATTYHVANNTPVGKVSAKSSCPVGLHSPKWTDWTPNLSCKKAFYHFRGEL